MAPRRSFGARFLPRVRCIEERIRVLVCAAGAAGTRTHARRRACSREPNANARAARRRWADLTPRFLARLSEAGPPLSPLAFHGLLLAVAGATAQGSAGVADAEALLARLLADGGAIGHGHIHAMLSCGVPAPACSAVENRIAAASRPCALILSRVQCARPWATGGRR